MALRDLAGEGPTRSCKLQTIFSMMSKSDQDELIELMADSTITGSGIARAISKQYARIGETSLRKCRSNCSCGLIKGKE